MNLIKYDTACRALAEAKSVDEVKDWHDKAAGIAKGGRPKKTRVSLTPVKDEKPSLAWRGPVTWTAANKSAA